MDDMKKKQDCFHKTTSILKNKSVQNYQNITCKKDKKQ